MRSFLQDVVVNHYELVVVDEKVNLFLNANATFRKQVLDFNAFVEDTILEKFESFWLNIFFKIV